MCVLASPPGHSAVAQAWESLRQDSEPRAAYQYSQHCIKEWYSIKNMPTTQFLPGPRTWCAWSKGRHLIQSKPINLGTLVQDCGACRCYLSPINSKRRFPKNHKDILWVLRFAFLKQDTPQAFLTFRKDHYSALWKHWHNVFTLCLTPWGEWIIYLALSTR